MYEKQKRAGGKGNFEISRDMIGNVLSSYEATQQSMKMVSHRTRFSDKEISYVISSNLEIEKNNSVVAREYHT